MDKCNSKVNNCSVSLCPFTHHWGCQGICPFGCSGHWGKCNGPKWELVCLPQALCVTPWSSRRAGPSQYVRSWSLHIFWAFPQFKGLLSSSVKIVQISWLQQSMAFSILSTALSVKDYNLFRGSLVPFPTHRAQWILSIRPFSASSFFRTDLASLALLRLPSSISPLALILLILLCLLFFLHPCPAEEDS